MRKTESVPTHLGDVEVETVECANCANQVLEEDSVHCAIGISGSLTNSVTRYKVDGRVGGHDYLCEYCAESVFGYTRDPSQARVASLLGRLDAGDVLFLLIAAWMFLMVFGPTLFGGGGGEVAL